MPKGGKRPGAGRPSGVTSRKPTRDVVKQVRWTAEEWKQVEDMAEGHGVTPSEFIRIATMGFCKID